VIEAEVKTDVETQMPVVVKKKKKRKRKGARKR
jgi:hypothetical protein